MGRHHTLNPIIRSQGQRTGLLRSLHEKVMSLDGETGQVMRFATAACAVAGTRVLDIGCGYGRFLGRLQAAGFEATGIDVNPEIVAANRKQGLHCLGVDEFRASASEYDVLLMSHFIEHFPPKDLLAVVDGYLDRLKVGGRLVIATPLMSDYFYDDFDHVKPYQPAGIREVFEDDSAQVQYRARNHLALRELWYRRSPKRIHHVRARHLSGPASRLILALDLLAGIAYLATGRLCGTVNGWVGVYEKTRA